MHSTLTMANEFDCLLQLIMLAKHHARCRACRPDPDAPTLALNHNPLHQFPQDQLL